MIREAARVLPLLIGAYLLLEALLWLASRIGPDAASWFCFGIAAGMAIALVVLQVLLVLHRRGRWGR